jgi:hypothetical protein
MPSKHLLELKSRLLGLEGTTTFAALAIAARAALRAVPLLERLSWEGPSPKGKPATGGHKFKSNSEIVQGTFRSVATASVAARWHNFGKSDRFQDIQHHARLAGAAADAGHASSAPASAGKAMEVAEITFTRLRELRAGSHRDSSAHFASQAVTIAALGFLTAYDRQTAERFLTSRDPNLIANRELAAAELAVWKPAWEDLRLLENGLDAQSLLTRPLWIVPAPDYARDEWRNLSVRLLQRVDEYWKFWIDWYEAMLAGPVGLSESSETARVSLPNDLWEQGPMAANTRIASLVV